MPDAEFTEKVEYYYQPQNEAWSNLELRALLLPILRQDIRLYESYVYHPESPLACPIDVFAGSGDCSTPVETTQAWEEHSSETVTHHVFDGGHFFLDAALADIQKIVAAGLKP